MGSAFNFKLDTPQAFNWDRMSHYETGHVTALSIAGKTFKTDLLLKDPVADTSIMVVGALASLAWSGDAGEAMKIEVAISVLNRQVAYELCHSDLGDTPEVFLKIVLYDYDWEKRKYYKKFVTLASLQGEIKNSKKHTGNWREEDQNRARQEVAREMAGVESGFDNLEQEKTRLATWAQQYRDYVTAIYNYRNQIATFIGALDTWVNTPPDDENRGARPVLERPPPKPTAPPAEGAKERPNTSDLEFEVKTDPEKDPPSPQNFIMTLGVVPGSTVQNIHVATGSNYKFVKKWGVPKTT